MEYTVNHYPEKHRFEVVEDGLTAYVEYRLRGDALDIIHTIVPKNLEGRGIQSEGQYGYEVERRGKFLRLLGWRRRKDQDV